MTEDVPPATDPSVNPEQIYRRQIETLPLPRRREIELCQRLEAGERRICRALGRNPVALGQALGILEAAKRDRRRAAGRLSGDPGEPLDAGAWRRIARTLEAFGRIRELGREIRRLCQDQGRVDRGDPEHEKIERRIERCRVRIRRQAQAIGVRRRRRLAAILQYAAEDLGRVREGVRRAEQALDGETDEILRTALEQRLAKARAEVRELEERYGITSFEEVTRAVAEIRRGEEVHQEAREQLIAANLRAVVLIAESFTRRGEQRPLGGREGESQMLDLIQEGNIGLMKAVERYDYRRGVRLRPFASWWIRYEILTAVDEKVRTIRLPRHVVETLRKLRSTRDSLFHELGREPTDEEIGGCLGLSASKVGQLRAIAREPLSLEALYAEPTGFDPRDVEDPAVVSPVETLFDAELGAAILQELGRLKPIQVRVLRLRFGFDGVGKHTHKEVGRAIGLTGARARQIQGDALRRLRNRVWWGRGRLREFLVS